MHGSRMSTRIEANRRPDGKRSTRRRKRRLDAPSEGCRPKRPRNTSGPTSAIWLVAAGVNIGQLNIGVQYR